MAFNLMSQLFGSKQGHQINTAIDTAGQQVLQKLGLEPTPEAVAGYIESKVDAAIAGETVLTTDEKSTFTNLANNLIQTAAAEEEG